MMTLSKRFGSTDTNILILDRYRNSEKLSKIIIEYPVTVLEWLYVMCVLSTVVHK